MQIKKIMLAVMALSAFTSNVMAQDNSLAANKNQNALIYGYDEMFQFDIEAFLRQRAPALAPHAEAISHWAGYTSISPKVLLTLMEQQTGAISKAANGALAANLNRPFGNLSAESSVAAQVQDVAHQLANMLYAEPKAAEAAEFGNTTKASPLHALFASRGDAAGQQLSADGKEVKAIADFAQTYQRLFGKSFDTASLAQPAVKSAQADAQGVAKLAGPANGFLQFPFPLGASWHVGGAHTNTGSGNYPMSSLDMSVGGGWGSNQSNVWVSSSQAGSFKKHSSCFAEIVHSGGWSTTYYHLMNVQYNTGATVNKNVRIANPANTKAQALCNGGSSTGPHEHFSLKQNGAWYHLNGVYLSGWQITATGSSYDTNCSRFYLTKNGVKKCSGYFTN